VGQAVQSHAQAGGAAEGERLIAEYRAAQARGEYDSEGYTPNERKAQRRRVR
jgi:hypothetical protein